MVISWSEGPSGGTPNEYTAAAWAESFGATYPFTIDPGWTLETAYGADAYIPSYFLIAPGLEMVAQDDMSAQNMIEQYLPY